MIDDDGGPAFPLADSCCEYSNTNRSAANGMTLRDYFAAKAMAAVWSKLDPDSVRDISVTQTAVTAYRLADAMLKAREGGK